MRKTFILAVVLLTFCTFAKAQENSSPLTPEATKKCYELTQAMSKKLYLYDSEYLKLKSLNEETMAQVIQIQHAYGQSPEVQQQKLAELSVVFEEKIKVFLEPGQLEALSSYRIEPAIWLGASNDFYPTTVSKATSQDRTGDQ